MKDKKLKTSSKTDVDLFMSKKVRIDNVIGMFSKDAKGMSLKVKPNGNGAMIGFMKRYIGKEVIIFVLETEEEK